MDLIAADASDVDEEKDYGFFIFFLKLIMIYNIHIPYR